jgi:tripartite-type tricarboxylate transporter receptor subunit TctC
MICRKIQFIRGALLLAVISALPQYALAQNYPTKAIRIILPYLGGTDFIGRWVAAKLSPDRKSVV